VIGAARTVGRMLLTPVAKLACLVAGGILGGELQLLEVPCFSKL
jgi:hypothetical protein